MLSIKIGILTLHQSMNYGALLQAYALKTVLDTYGDVKIINYDYYNYGPYRCMSDEDIVTLCKSPLYGDYVRQQLAKDSIHTLADPIVVIKKFINFRDKYLNMTPLLDEEQILNGELEDFDCIVSGSDQIWNAKPSRGVDKIFYQQFPGKAKKLAYAASIAGRSFTKEEEREIVGYMRDFSVVSLREREDAEYFSKLFKLSALAEKNIYAALDPVLLLSREHWEEFSQAAAAEYNQPDKKYLLVYKPVNPHLSWFVDGYNHIADKLGLNVIYVAQRWYDKLYPKDVPDPVDFVSLFKNAEFVYTNSFHGMLFSVIFKKPFVITALGATSVRFTNIMETLGIQGRVAETFDDILNVRHEMDFSGPEGLLKTEVRKSYNIISSFFEDTVR